MGTIFGYYFYLIGNICHITKTSVTYREAWQDTIGSTGSIAIATVNMLKPFLGVSIFFVMKNVILMFVDLISSIRLGLCFFSHSHPVLFGLTSLRI